jgi:hypothetical protein
MYWHCYYNLYSNEGCHVRIKVCFNCWYNFSFCNQYSTFTQHGIQQVVFIFSRSTNTHVYMYAVIKCNQRIPHCRNKSKIKYQNQNRRKRQQRFNKHTNTWPLTCHNDSTSTQKYDTGHNDLTSTQIHDRSQATTIKQAHKYMTNHRPQRFH